MKFIYAVFALSSIVSSASATPVSDGFMKRDVPENLVPQFGVQAGENPNPNTKNCEGINGIAIPCSCPPDRNQFIADLNANVNAGRAVNNPEILVSGFPTDDSIESKLKRYDVATITLQNLNGPGVGCPAASTNWNAIVAELNKQKDAAAAGGNSAATSGSTSPSVPASPGDPQGGRNPPVTSSVPKDISTATSSISAPASANPTDNSATATSSVPNISTAASSSSVPASPNPTASSKDPLQT